MKETVSKRISAQYREIALDIANRIVSGELCVGERLYGRSLMASEYGVSPETIRRAFRRLDDMKVLEVMPQSGARVLSVDSARRYLEEEGESHREDNLSTRLHELLLKQSALSKELGEVSSALARRQETFFAAKEQDYGLGEARVSGTSWVIGKSIGALAFWQTTQATIIAIRRGQSLIVSPGPFAELYKNDCIVYVAKESDFDRVSEFINNKEYMEGKEPKRG